MKKKRKDAEEDEESDIPENELKKYGIVRMLSILVALIFIVAFVLTENIKLPTALLDK